MARTEQYPVKKILKAIEGTGGIKTAIAAKLDINRRTVDNYENKYPTVRQAIRDELEKVTDKAESNLFVKIKEGDEDTSKWFLARKGRERGYAEKTEQKIEGEIKTIIEVCYDKGENEEECK